ncbi:MAG: sigma-70 family RNA polymerase sigma factor [Candidatus Fibromonas sp.]|jgi:RNA polymerase sigma-70 factor (ECF subfamily)|nr:sigma-70 family RNA polymerase sigma factor [Candidatus Fibromonas sp.]
MNVSKLWQENSAYVLKICMRYVGDSAAAEDIRQEVFLRVINSKKTFNEQSAVKTWLYAITFRCCMDYYREKRKERQMMDEFFQMQDIYLGDSRNPVWKVNYVSETACPLSQLFVELYYGEGWSMKEISGIFGINLAQVKKKIRIGIKHLQGMV